MATKKKTKVKAKRPAPKKTTRKVKAKKRAVEYVGVRAGSRVVRKAVEPSMDSTGPWPIVPPLRPEDTGHLTALRPTEEAPAALPEGWSRFWRDDRGIWENTCPHGIGHPSKASAERTGDGIHGCDGCCSTLKET